jgi:hypothetical protein
MIDKDQVRAKSTIRNDTGSSLLGRTTPFSPTAGIKTRHNLIGSLSRVDRGKEANVLPVIDRNQAKDLRKYLSIDPGILLNPHTPKL